MASAGTGAADQKLVAGELAAAALSGFGTLGSPGPASRRPLEALGAEKWEGALYGESGASIVLADREIKTEIPA